MRVQGTRKGRVPLTRVVMNRGIMKIKILMVMVLLLYSRQLYAYCEGGYPNISVSDEIKKCEFIVIGTVVSRYIVVDPIEDPEGYEAEIFHIEIESILNGTPKDKLIKPYMSVYNDNDSGRFPMHVGEKYLLFVYSDRDGLWINSCGNSATYNRGRETINEIKKILIKKSK
jgi:hypothetical protein